MHPWADQIRQQIKYVMILKALDVVPAVERRDFPECLNDHRFYQCITRANYRWMTAESVLQEIPTPKVFGLNRRTG
jgi:hypothetical protein